MYNNERYIEEAKLQGFTKNKATVVELRGLLLSESHLLERNLAISLLSLARTVKFNFFFLPFHVGGLPIFKSPILSTYELPIIAPLEKKLPAITEILRATGEETYLGATIPLFYVVQTPEFKIVHRLLRYYKAWAMRSATNDFIEIQEPGETEHKWWLCPANKEYRHFLADILTDAVNKLPISAVVFDVSVLREMPKLCFCEYCQQKIMELGGETALRHRDELPNNEAIRLQWLKWIHKQMLEFLGYLKARLQSQRSDLLLMLYVERAELNPAQNTRELPWIYLWDRSFVDELLVTNYSANPQAYTDELRADLRYLSPGLLFLPVISTSEIYNLEAMITISSELSPTGWVLKYNRHLLLAELEEMGNNLFIHEALPGEISPLLACKVLLERITSQLMQPNEIKKFLVDVLRLVDTIPPEALPKWMKSVLNNIININQRLNEGQLTITADNSVAVKIYLRRLETLLGYFSKSALLQS